MLVQQKFSCEEEDRFFSKNFNFNYVDVHVYVRVSSACLCRWPQRSQEGINSPESKDTGGYELPDMGAGE